MRGGGVINDFNLDCDITDESTFTLGLAFPAPIGSYSTCSVPFILLFDNFYYDAELPAAPSAHFLDIQVIGFTDSGCLEMLETIFR